MDYRTSPLLMTLSDPKGHFSCLELCKILYLQNYEKNKWGHCGNDAR